MNKEQLNIRHIPTDKKQYLSLLLLADEQESMIDRYLERGELYVMLDEQTGWADRWWNISSTVTRTVAIRCSWGRAIASRR